MSNNIRSNQKEFSQNHFENMGWHDCKIHAMSFNDLDFELLFDIDYILDWVKPDGSDNYLFTVSPATLIFENVWDLNINIEHDLNMRIENIHRKNPRIPKNKDLKDELEFDWLVEMSNGDISFKSIGYKQYLRGKTIKSNYQVLSNDKRGGILFVNK